VQIPFNLGTDICPQDIVYRGYYQIEIEMK